MIRFKNITKIYDYTPALIDVSFDLNEGCVGLLGPNGAGKTTSLKLMAGLIKPNQGSVEIFGENPFNNPRVVRRIGYQPEFDQPYPWMTGMRYLKLIGKLYGLRGGVLDNAINDVIESFGLRDFIHRKIGGYSRGMRQRIKLAQALIHDPEIILFDEPLSGLDPVWRRNVLEVIKDLRRDGRLIIFSTHLLFDAEELCNYIVFLYSGRVIAEGPMAEIHRYFLSREFEVNLIVRGEDRPSVSFISDLKMVNGYHIEKRGDKWLISVKVTGKSGYFELLRSLLGSDLEVIEISVDQLDLDNIYASILRNIKGGQTD